MKYHYTTQFTQFHASSCVALLMHIQMHVWRHMKQARSVTCLSCILKARKNCNNTKTRKPSNISPSSSFQWQLLLYPIHTSMQTILKTFPCWSVYGSLRLFWMNILNVEPDLFRNCALRRTSQTNHPLGTTRMSLEPFVTNKKKFAVTEMAE